MEYEYNVGEDMEAYAKRRIKEENYPESEDKRIIRRSLSFRRGPFGHGGGPESIFDQISFFLPLTDSGAGTVNLVPGIGAGVATFTRATTAWTKRESGLWASVGSGVARSAYIGMNTAVGAYGGYLAEGAGTQLVTPTASIRDMTNAAWAKVTMTTAFTSTGIGGVVNSCTRLTATGATSTILQTLVAAASTRTYSCWIKRITGTGTINLAQGATTLDVTALINSATFTLVQLPSSTLNSAFGIQIITSGDALDVDFNQFEAGGFATSPMDAAGAARNADVLTYPTAGWFNAAAGTLFVQALSEHTGAATDNIVSISDGTSNERIYLDRTAANALRGVIQDGGVTQAVLSSGTATNGVAFKSAIAYALNDVAFSGNGAAVATDAAATLPTVTTLEIAGAISIWAGPITGIRYWSTRLPDATLETLTA